MKPALRSKICATVGCKNIRRIYDCYCRDCRVVVNRAWREANPEKMKDARDRERLARKGRAG